MQNDRQDEELSLKLVPVASPPPANIHALSWIWTRTAYALGATLGFSLSGLAALLAGGAWAAAGGLLWAVGVTLLLVPTRIRIDNNGLYIRWLWVTRSIPLDDIEAASVYDEVQWGRYREIGLRIALRSTVLYLPVRYHDRLAFWIREPEKTTVIALACLHAHMPERRVSGRPDEPDPRAS